MENEKLIKPVAILRKELQEKIVNAINESGMPMSFVAYQLKDILEQVSTLAAQQENKEIEEYNAQIKGDSSSK